MNKMFKKLFLIFSLLFLLIDAVSTYAVSSEISKIRIKKIADIIRRYTNAKEKLSDPYVQEAIMDEVDKELTLEPVEKANLTGVKEVAKQVRDKVAKRFPDSIKKVKAKAIKEAEKKFKMAEKLDMVTVSVQRGRKTYSVSGIFYGYGVGGKSVRIGDKTPIAFFDLSPLSRAKFDKTYCEREKKNFIDEKIRNYYRKKGNYANTLFAEIREKIASENEALGYIYAWNKWRTPQNVTEYLIEKLKIQQEEELKQLALKNKDPEKDPEDGTPPKNGENNTTETNPDQIPKVDDGIESEKLRLAKLKKSIEERQLEIAGSQYGIDADQGFSKDGKRVLWGMKQEDVNLIFKGEIAGDMNSDVQTCSYEKGAIKSVSLFFINGLFYKVEIQYNIGPMEAMSLLWKNLNEKYGESAEQKAMREAEEARKARLAKITLCPPDKKTKKEGHQWDKKTGKCKKCHVIKTDLYPPPPPLEQEFTWTGKITKGKLNVRFNANRDNLTLFNLTKENTDIEATQRALIEAEEKRRAEEEKRRKLEEYKKSLD